MSNDPALFFFGVVGFAAFEAYRIYLALHLGRSVKPLRSKTLYCIVLAILGVLAGVLASSIARDEAWKAVYVGLSVPSLLQSAVKLADSRNGQPKSTSKQGPAGMPDIRIDDIKTEALDGSQSSSQVSWSIRRMLKDYFFVTFK